MKSLQTIQPNPSSRKYWKLQIKTAWKEATEAFLQVGNLLIQSKSELEHGEFLEMIENDLPFSPRTSQMLMTISSDRRLSNTNNGSYLPPSWRTLYELTKLDDISFKKSIKDGTIHPDMLRKEATRLRKRYEYELDEKERVPFVKKRNTKFKIYNEDCISGCRKRIESNSIDDIHTYATFGLYADVPIDKLASNMGCGVSFIEKHYGHVQQEKISKTLTQNWQKDESSKFIMEL